MNVTVAAQLADGLGCQVDDLIGSPAAVSRSSSGYESALGDLQRALISTTIDVPPSDVASWRQARADIRRVRELRQECDYQQAARLAGACLQAAHSAVDGPYRAEATPALAHLYFDIAIIARTLGDPSSGWIASRRCRGVGMVAGSNVIKAGAMLASAHIAVSLRVPHRALALAEETIPAIAADSPESVALRGMLHLVAALSAHRADPSDRVTSARHLSQAAELTDAAIGDTDPFAMCFSRTNVFQWQMAIALNAGDYDRAAQALAGIDPAAITSVPRRCAYNIDLARLYAASGRDTYAVRMLVRANTIAPQYCAYDSGVASVVKDLMERRLGDHALAQLRLIKSRHL